MTSRDFCFWLQGAFEVIPAGPLSADQVEVVKRHLALVVQHEIDPSMGAQAGHQQALDATHARPTGNKPVMRC